MLICVGGDIIVGYRNYLARSKYHCIVGLQLSNSKRTRILQQIHLYTEESSTVMLVFAWLQKDKRTTTIVDILLCC